MIGSRITTLLGVGSIQKINGSIATVKLDEAMKVMATQEIFDTVDVNTAEEPRVGIYMAVLPVLNNPPPGDLGDQLYHKASLRRLA
jgi:hypothetical protein